ALPISENSGVIRLARFVLDKRKLTRTTGSVGGRGETGESLFSRVKRGQAVLDVLLRIQHRVLVVQHRLLKGRILHPHLVDQPAVIEDRPEKGGSSLRRLALPHEDVP